MSEPELPHNQPPAAAAPDDGPSAASHGTSPGNKLGAAALILGVLAVVLSMIPAAGFAPFVLGPLAAVVGIIALARKNLTKIAAAVGLVLGLLAVGTAAIVTARTSVAAHTISDDPNKEHRVEFVVSSVGKSRISYTTGSDSSTADSTGTWKKSVTMTGSQTVTLSVSADRNTPDELSCEIIVDGQSLSKNTGSGTGATAACRVGD
jgi:lysylphosphatidylglycerol synthetase-like protein (DUF2156 family)